MHARTTGRQRGFSPFPAATRAFVDATRQRFPADITGAVPSPGYSMSFTGSEACRTSPMCLRHLSHVERSLGDIGKSTLPSSRRPMSRLATTSFLRRCKRHRLSGRPDRGQPSASSISGRERARSDSAATILGQLPKPYVRRAEGRLARSADTTLPPLDGSLSSNTSAHRADRRLPSRSRLSANSHLEALRLPQRQICP